MATKIPRRFEFNGDTFAFANELVWEYRPDAATGKMNFLPREPKPDYAHRCFVLTRAARQFLYHARFDKKLPLTRPNGHPLPAGRGEGQGEGRAGEELYRCLVREILSRSPRKPCGAENRIVIPGYANLREFSTARERLLKSECGGAWQSYVLRSHWRMVFPISRMHQERTFDSIRAALGKNISPIVHLVKFPSLTINHGMILFDAAKTGSGWEFSAYDPNDPEKPARLIFDEAAKTFSLPPNRYWPGGALNVIEIYRNWMM